MGKVIALVGRTCSGKSTIGKRLAEKYNYTFHSMGEFYRNNLGGIGDYTEIDALIEEHTYGLLASDNVILEGRTVGILLNQYKLNFPGSEGFSVLLDVNIETQIERYLQRELISDNDIAKNNILKKDGFDEERLFQRYGLDIFDKNNYDFAIDTSDLNIEEVCDLIAQQIKGV